jgi:hypothetical protein
MDNTHIAKLMLSFQRQTYENVCQSVELLQDYSEKSVQTLVAQNQWIPAQGRQVYDQWTTAYRQGCQAVKEAVDGGFDRWQEFLEGVDRTT